MADVPERYKERSAFTMDEEVVAVQAVRRGKPEPKIETDEYKEYRAAALREAGLEDEADEQPGDPLDVEAMTVDDHYQRIRRHQ